MHTGLSKQLSRFQARSAFTGVGFTTSEAEKIVRHPLRRKIIMLLMLLGNAGIVSVIASFMLTFLNTDEGNLPIIYRLLVLTISIMILWYFSYSSWVDRWLSRIISRLLKRYTSLNISDYDSLLHLSNEFEISEMLVEQSDWMANKTLAELTLKAEGINVLGVTRKDSTFIGIPTGKTRVEPGDLLVLYGRKGVLKNLDERKSGIHGNIEHKKLVKENEVIEAEQEKLDQNRKKKENKSEKI
jgi:NhaP-type Na+/H+ and K+/H+ antiporter